VTIPNNKMTKAPFFSIIIPVYNGGDPFKRCLDSIRRSSFSDLELILVDDGSSDGSDDFAEQAGVSVFRTGGQQGPAAARNVGAQMARGHYLGFIDADCELQANTLAELARLFESDPGLDAVFGSYDASPAAANFISQYKNLFHHYVHQHSSEEAATFWTGCGAIKRSRFLKLGGFDLQRYRRPSIEDIDLGYRLKQAGGQIRLAKHIQVKHLKTWTFASLLRSDILDRGIPWTQLVLRHKAFAPDLNLQTHNRISVVAVYGLFIAVLVSLFQSPAIALVSGLAGLMLWLNFDLYRFFGQQRGWLFALRVIPVHWLYYFYNAISFGCGLGLHWKEQLKAETSPPPKPWVDGVESD
jgi:glycosyltransferase involved in cell wall biosynthesis